MQEHLLERIEQSLADVRLQYVILVSALQTILQQQRAIMSDIDDLKNKAIEVKGVVEGLKTAYDKLAGSLGAAQQAAADALARADASDVERAKVQAAFDTAKTDLDAANAGIREGTKLVDDIDAFNDPQVPAEPSSAASMRRSHREGR